MDKLLKLVGDLGAVVGVLICIAAGVSRIGGNYHLAGFETVTLFIVGIAIMLTATLAKLYRIENR